MYRILMLEQKYWAWVAITGGCLSGSGLSSVIRVNLGYSLHNMDKECEYRLLKLCMNPLQILGF